jgi:hypothetical protein
MSFTYDPATDRGRVRLLVRDTAESGAVFTDAEIDALLDLANDSVLLAASLACRDLAGRGVKQFTGIAVGGYRLDSSTADGWLALADHYERLAYDRAGGATVEVDWDSDTAETHWDNYALRGTEQPDAD